MDNVKVWDNNRDLGLPFPYLVQGPDIEVEVDGSTVSIEVKNDKGDLIEMHVVRNFFAVATGSD